MFAKIREICLFSKEVKMKACGGDNKKGFIKFDGLVKSQISEFK
jgi:hypothetical protein